MKRVLRVAAGFAATVFIHPCFAPTPSNPPSLLLGILEPSERLVTFVASDLNADKRRDYLFVVVYRLPNEELESAFIGQAKKAGIVGVKGHRSAGGIRVSTYNAVPLESVRTVSQFMAEFARGNG